MTTPGDKTRLARSSSALSGRPAPSALTRIKNSRLSQLWQLPLLLLSLALFGYAAYLFIDPQPGQTIEQKMEAARTFIQQDRAEAAIAYLNKLLNKENLTAEQQGRIHMMLAESIDLGQKQLHEKIPANYLNIIEQTKRAVARGIKPDFTVYRRLGEAYEALDRPKEALENLRNAMALDPDHTLRIQRKVIDLQLAQEDPAAAGTTLEQYLKDPNLTEAERSWALTTQAEILIDASRFVDARLLLDEALKLATDPIAQGQVNYQLGYCAYKLKDSAEAERYLRVARDQLKTQHPLDGDAAYLLGKIAQERNDPNTALSFYDDVLVNHIDSRIVPLARLGRGLCRIALMQDDPGLTDLHDLVGEISQKPSRKRFRDETVTGLQTASSTLNNHGNFQGATEVLTYEQTLVPDPAPSFFARLGTVYEHRADQIEKTIPQSPANEKIRHEQLMRELRIKAGTAFIAYSNKLTLADDKAYGDALWKGIDLFDRAGSVQNTVSALELFVAERPDDPLTPDALLRLGRAYQSSGMFDKAISAYQRNQFRYPQSLAASKSAVALAQAYIAKGSETFGKAETVLMSVVDNNPLVTPEAEEFRAALLELGKLYYHTNRFEEAVARLEEFTKRYPNDDRMPQLVFLMADSYRKSAAQLDTKLTANSATASINEGASVTIDVAEAVQARRDRLTKAKQHYDRVVDMFRDKSPTQDADKLYLKLAYFYRADCLYDLGQYADSIGLYDKAASRYQADPSALAAYVQIVNAYCALGKAEEAKTANERAKQLLKQIPADSFADGSFSMPKAYWEQWLKWQTTAGMW